MSNSKYIDLYELTEFQTKIMQFITKWVREQKTPIPQKEVIKAMEKEGIKSYTVAGALNFLLRNGFIRRAVITSNQTFYVQIKTI